MFRRTARIGFAGIQSRNQDRVWISCAEITGAQILDGVCNAPPSFRYFGPVP